VIAAALLALTVIVCGYFAGNVSSAIGSGEFVTADGYVTSNAHVVTSFNSYSVTLTDGSSLPATLVGEYHQDDLTLLIVNSSNALVMTLPDSSAAKVGEFVVAIGSPLGAVPLPAVPDAEWRDEAASVPKRVEA
jgi:serine protease Do